jgi:hypothetical protein
VAEGNGLLNRPVGIHPLRGFESRPLRFFMRKSGFLTVYRDAAGDKLPGAAQSCRIHSERKTFEA